MKNKQIDIETIPSLAHAFTLEHIDKPALLRLARRIGASNAVSKGAEVMLDSFWRNNEDLPIDDIDLDDAERISHDVFASVRNAVECALDLAQL